VKVEATAYGDRKVFSVSAFNRGIATWLQRLPTVWVEGEVTGLKRHQRWQSVFFTLKDPADGACVGVSMPRGQFDGLRLELADGDRVHAYGRPELYAARGEFRLRALSLERFGLGDHLAALERLKQKLAAEGLFAAERKRALPVWPRKIGLVTGNDAAAKRDVLTGIQTRFPPAHVVVAETYVQGPRAAGAVADALRRSARCRTRRRRRPRRRQLRGPPALQRRTARPCNRHLPGPDRFCSRPRARHPALRPRRGRSRVDADRGGTTRRSGSRRATSVSSAPAAASAAAPGVHSS
jgi:hypothetical protein